MACTHGTVSGVGYTCEVRVRVRCGLCSAFCSGEVLASWAGRGAGETGRDGGLTARQAWCKCGGAASHCLHPTCCADAAKQCNNAEPVPASHLIKTM